MRRKTSEQRTQAVNSLAEDCCHCLHVSSLKQEVQAKPTTHVGGRGRPRSQPCAWGNVHEQLMPVAFGN